MRTIVLFYGFLGYAAFLAALTYAMGFVSNVAVPRSLDAGGPATPLAFAIIINASLLLLFAVQHTIMARPAFKRWITRFIPSAAERSTFVWAASAALSLAMWQWRPLGGDLWRVDAQALPWIFALLAATGWGIVLYSSFLVDHWELFGVRQVLNYYRNQPDEPRGFVTRSLYKRVRHPLMLGFVIAFWATPHMTVSHLLFSLLVTAYILVGIRFEERDLRKALGPAYAEYCEKTPMLFPRASAQIDSIAVVGSETSAIPRLVSETNRQHEAN